jgi:hypothetical protein
LSSMFLGTRISAENCAGRSVVDKHAESVCSNVH